MAIRYLSGINVDSNTLFVDSTNNRVGIGTDSPSRQLELVGSDAYIQLTRSSASTQATLGFNTGATNDWLIRTGDGSTSNLQFYSYGTSSYVMTIARSSGNVGIGTTSPLSLLHVYGSNPRNLIQDAGAGHPYVQLSNSSGNFYLSIDNSAGTGFGSAYGRYLYSEGAYPMILVTNSAERMRITSGGSVLIATSTNPYTLGSLVVSHDSTLTRTYFQRGVELIEIVPSDGTGPNIISSSYTSSGSAYKPLSLSGRQNNADLYLTTNGNVGIGTTNPGAKLDVNGDAWFTNGGSLNAIITQGAAGKGRLYLYDGGNATIALQTNGASYFNAGNVGIGTTSPAEKLHVYGTGNQIIKIENSGTYLMYLGLVSNEGYIGSSNATPLTFYTNNVSRMYITTGGNVGIGTTSPAAKLHTVGEGIVDIVQSSNTVSYTQYYTSSTGASSTSDGLTVGLNGLDGYVFLREAANLILGTSDTERLRITAAGNVGIGTTSPQDKLTVKGATNYNLNLGLLGGYSGIYVYNDASSAYNHLRIDASPLLLNSYSGGNVGIGTASPAEKLHVSGKILQNNGGSLYLDANATNTILASVGARAVVFEVDSANRLVIGSTGTIRLNNYGSGSKTGTVAYNLAVDSSGNIIETAGGVVDGSGTANYVSKWSDANTLTDSVIYDNGTNVGIGTTPNQGVRLQVAGAVDAWNSLNTLLRLSHDGTRGKIQSYTGGGYSPTALNADGGNVLIGTTTDAGYKLDVNGTAIVRGNMSTDGELGITLAWSGSTINDQRIGRIRPISTPSQNPYAGGLAFDYYKYDGSAYNFFEGIRLNGSGNVGIGTISPNARLTVVANDSSNPNVALRLSSTGYSGVPYPYTSIRFGSAYSSYPSWNLASIDAGYTGASWGGSLLFYTNNDSGETNLTERMRITSDGNVAINSTTTSGYRLYVNGSTWINGGTNFQDGVSIFRTESGAAEVMRIASNGNVGIGTTSPATKLHTIGYVRTDGGMIVNGSDANYREIIFTTSSASRWNLYTYGAEGGANAGSVLYLARYADNGDYIANVATFLRTNGYVGIATTTPTQQLHVSGNVRVTGAYYDSSNSAGSSGQVLSSTGSGTDWVSLSEISGVDGTGTANYVAKWSDADTIANSSITDNGSTVTANVDRLNMNKQAGIYTFSKTVAATVASDFFSISNSHGAQAFRVTFVCSSSGYSVAKTYEVVHAYGLAPIYFKVVDTGPYGSEDFDVAFTNSNSDTGVKATVTNNSATLSGNIVATVFLGGGFETITITAL